MKFHFIQDKADYTHSFLVYIIILIIPALFLHLGMMPFILDEATRANVALEMIFSGNYMVPTINGEFYYNKPPLFNWLQVFFVKVMNSQNEFVFRLPTVLSLLLFALTVYNTQKKEAGRRVALFSALALLTCGRILFYDSFRGLIDITFSWCMYLLFWYIYKFGRRKEFFNLFFVTYLLGVLGFFMKGLPALVFLGISLFVYFVYSREFKRLFAWQHFAGFFFLSLIIGAWFLVYSQYNSLDHYFSNLWVESSKRTFLDNSLWDSVKHVFIFPVDFIFHFLPWTFLLLVLIIPGARREVIKNQFARFSILIFISNILVYWLSPAIYPRYLFMFLPLVFYIVFLGVCSSTRIEDPDSPGGRVIRIITGIFILGINVIPFFINREIYSFLFLRIFLVFILSMPFIYFVIKGRINTLVVLTGLLLLIRVVFNLFVFEDRNRNGSFIAEKNGAIVAAELSGDIPLYLYQDTRIQHASSFYIMREKGQILRRWEGEADKRYFYIVEEEMRSTLPSHRKIVSFETRINHLKLALVQFE